MVTWPYEIGNSACWTLRCVDLHDIPLPNNRALAAPKELGINNLSSCKLLFCKTCMLLLYDVLY